MIYNVRIHEMDGVYYHMYVNDKAVGIDSDLDLIPSAILEKVCGPGAGAPLENVGFYSAEQCTELLLSYGIAIEIEYVLVTNKQKDW